MEHNVNSVSATKYKAGNETVLAYYVANYGPLRFLRERNHLLEVYCITNCFC